jgi:hypothetical protein
MNKLDNRKRVPDVNVEIKPGKEIKCNGYIATLREARKRHICSVCGFPIEPKKHYYEIVAGGGGLGWLKFPDRCHIGCLNQYLERRR